MSVRAFVVVATLGLVLLAGCGDDESRRSDTLVVGVSGTNPGLSQMHPDGTFTGFEIDLVGHLARGLGWSERDVTFKTVTSEQREQALTDGTVDLVVAAYAVTPDRERTIDFAGPYLVVGQDLLVPGDSTITGPRGLTGRAVCVAEDSPEAARLAEPRFSEGARLVEAPGRDECVDLLLAGDVDAVTGDDATLAGYVVEHPDRLRLVGSPFSTTYYGIGLPEGSPDVAVVDDLVRRALADGTWQAELDEHLGASGWSPPPPVPGTTG